MDAGLRKIDEQLMRLFGIEPVPLGQAMLAALNAVEAMDGRSGRPATDHGG